MQVEEHEGYGKVTLPDTVNLINAPEFKHALKLLYEKDIKIIKVDCSCLKTIDCAGIGSLVVFQKRLKNCGGELRLINVTNGRIKQLFDMIELVRVISIEHSGEQAGLEAGEFRLKYGVIFD